MSYNFMYGIPNLLFTMKLLFDNFRGNALGGLTAGIVALPLALAFGVSSGLGPSVARRRTRAAEIFNEGDWNDW